jgi:hypothetical protein
MAAETQTKRVRQTTVEEYNAPIETVTPQTENKPRVIDIQPIETFSNNVSDYSETDKFTNLKQAIGSGDITWAKELLVDVCKSQTEQAITFLNLLPEDMQATVIVERLPDAINQKDAFLNKCHTPTKLQNYTWYGGQSDETDLNTTIASNFGGGNYRFEIRYNKGFTGLSWKETLADSAEWIEKHKQSIEQSALQILEQKNRELEEKLNQLSTSNNSNQSFDFAKLQVEIERMRGDNQLSIAEMKHTMELERMKTANEKPLIVDSPFGLLQVAFASGNSDLVNVAKEMLDSDSKKTFVDHVFETLDNPERTQTIVGVAMSALGSLSSLLAPKPPIAPPQVAPPKPSPVEEYRAKLKAEKAKREQAKTKPIKTETIGDVCD